MIEIGGKIEVDNLMRFMSVIQDAIFHLLSGVNIQITASVECKGIGLVGIEKILELDDVKHRLDSTHGEGTTSASCSR